MTTKLLPRFRAGQTITEGSLNALVNGVNRLGMRGHGMVNGNGVFDRSTQFPFKQGVFQVSDEVAGSDPVLYEVIPVLYDDVDEAWETDGSVSFVLDPNWGNVKVTDGLNVIAFYHRQRGCFVPIAVPPFPATITGYDTDSGEYSWTAEITGGGSGVIGTHTAAKEISDFLFVPTGVTVWMQSYIPAGETEPIFAFQYDDQWIRATLTENWTSANPTASATAQAWDWDGNTGTDSSFQDTNVTVALLRPWDFTDTILTGTKVLAKRLRRDTGGTGTDLYLAWTTACG